MANFNLFKNIARNEDNFSEKIKADTEQASSFSEAKILSEKDKVIKIANIYLDKYNHLLEEIFKAAVEMNPQAFRLRNKNNLKIIHLYLNKQFLPQNNVLALVYSKNSNLQYELVDLTDSDFYSDYGEFQSDYTFIDSLIVNNLQLKLTDIIFSFNIENFLYASNIFNAESFEDTMSTFSGTMLEQMKSLIRKEGGQYQKHINHPSGYYAKNAARYSFSLLDLSPILEKVSNEDFEYQLDQAIAAYDNSLYMASCAALGVCLETVCKVIITRNGGKIKDSDATMLDKLGERLRADGIITYKDKSRIDVSYRVRNLSSHTSPGKVTQNDCHFLINTIQSLVEQYLD